MTMRRERLRKRKGLTLAEILIVVIIMPMIVGAALMYLHSGLKLTDAAQHHAMDQQAMRLPFMKVSNMVEHSEELEILSHLPETLNKNSAYIYLDPDDHSMYIRSLSGDVVVDDKIPGFERVADLMFARTWFTADGGAPADEEEAKVSQGVRMTMTARGGPRLVDAPGTAKEDVPGLMSSTDMRSMNLAEVSGDASGAVLRIENNVLVLRAELLQIDFEEGTNDLRFDANGRLLGKMPEGKGLGLEEEFFGQFTLEKGDMDRVAYEWRVYDYDATALDVKDQNAAKYQVIGRDSDYQSADLNKHYGANGPLTGLLGGGGFGFSCIPDPDKKPTDNVIRANFLIPEPVMEGHLVAFAVGGADEPRSSWVQSTAYRVHDVGVFATNLKNQLAKDLDNKNGISDRVLLNGPGDGAESPQDRVLDIRMEYDDETQQSYIAIEGVGNIEIPFLSGKLTRRYFPHAREPKTIDVMDEKGNKLKKKVWVRSREFCPENYTIWIDAMVGDGTTDDMAGYGIVMNGNTSRDLEAKIDRVYGYMFQFDPGMSGWGGGPGGIPASWHVGGGHVKANTLPGYTWAQARAAHLDAAFEYYYNRSVHRNFMNLAPKDRPHGIAEGLLVRELQGGTNGPMRGVSEMLRFHKIPSGMASGRSTTPTSNPKGRQFQDVDEVNSKAAKLARYSMRKTDVHATLNTIPLEKIKETDAANGGKGKYYNATDGCGRGVKIDDLVYYNILDADRRKSSNTEAFKTYGQEGKTGDVAGKDLVAELRSDYNNRLVYYPTSLVGKGNNAIGVYTQWRFGTDLDAGQYYTRGLKATEGTASDGTPMDVSYLRDRFVVKAIDQKNDNNGWGMRYYLWGDLSYWAEAAEYWLVSDDYCDEYGKHFGMEPVDEAAYEAYLRTFDETDKDQKEFKGDVRFKSMVGQKYTVAINVVTQTKSEPAYEWDPELGRWIWNEDRTVPTNMFCRVRVYDGPRYRVLERDQRQRQDYPAHLESEFRLADGTWDDEKFTVRRFVPGTSRSRDAWFGFIASADKDGKDHWIPTPDLPDQTDASNLQALIDSRKAPDMWYKGPTKEDNALVWSPRREMSFWRNLNFKISDREDERPTAKSTSGYMGWTWTKYHWTIGDNYYLPKDVLAIVSYPPDKWWMSNADRRYYYIKMDNDLPLVTDADRANVKAKTSARSPAILTGPGVSNAWNNYRNDQRNSQLSAAQKERRMKTFDLSEVTDKDGNPMYSYMGDKAKSVRLPYAGAGFPIFPGDTFYRIGKDALLPEKKIAYRKSGTPYEAEPGPNDPGGSSIGQDIALRLFAPRMTVDGVANNKKFTAKIYYMDVERGFTEDYVFPWGTKLKDLLAEPNWNRYEAFQPVDGVKATNEERIND